MDLDKVYELINNIPVTEQNEQLIEEIRADLAEGEYRSAMEKLQQIKEMGNNEENKKEVKKRNKKKEEDKSIYPVLLSNIELEHIYMGLLLNNPKYIVKYYFYLAEIFYLFLHQIILEVLMLLL